MAPNELASEQRLAEELQFLCAQVGYRAGTNGTEAIKDVPALIGLVIVGGPSQPNGILEWRARRDCLRAVLREIIEKEVAEELGGRYAEAATRIFRLDARQPLDIRAHVSLGEIQTPLNNEFGGGIKSFQNSHRPLIFAVMARALLARERQAKAGTAETGKDSKPAARRRSRKKVATADRKQRGDHAGKQKRTAAPRQGASGTTSNSRPKQPGQRRAASTDESAPRIHNPRRVSPRRRAVMERRKAERRAAKALARENRAWFKWLLTAALLAVVFILLVATGAVPT